MAIIADGHSTGIYYTASYAPTLARHNPTLQSRVQWHCAMIVKSPNVEQNQTSVCHHNLLLLYRPENLPVC